MLCPFKVKKLLNDDGTTELMLSVQSLSTLQLTLSQTSLSLLLRLTEVLMSKVIECTNDVLYYRVICLQLRKNF